MLMTVVIVISEDWLDHCLRQEHESAVNHLNQKQAEAARLKTELQDEKTRRGQVERVLQEAAAALKEVM